MSRLTHNQRAALAVGALLVLGLAVKGLAAIMGSLPLPW